MENGPKSYPGVAEAAGGVTCTDRGGAGGEGKADEEARAAFGGEDFEEDFEDGMRNTGGAAGEEGAEVRGLAGGGGAGEAVLATGPPVPTPGVGPRSGTPSIVQ